MIATVRWTADQVLRRLLPEGELVEWRDTTGTVQLAEVAVSPAWVGRPLTRLEAASGARIAFLTRFGEGVLPGADTVLQDGDLVHVVLREKDREKVDAVFAAGPERED